MSDPNTETAAPLPPGWLSRWPWVTFLLPMLVYMLVGTLEPSPSTPGGGAIGLAIPYESYPIVYNVKIALTIAAMLVVLPGYRTFPFRVSPLAILVGVVGVVAWIGLCKLGIEARLLRAAELDAWISERSGYNPLTEIAHRQAAYAFLAVRFLGLALIVPIFEEFFLRGFLMRFFVAGDWWRIPIGAIDRDAIIAVTVVPILMHPLSEALAVVVWFSSVTLLVIYTRNIWDCVVAHAVTNLLLGLYVLYSDDWWLM